MARLRARWSRLPARFRKAGSWSWHAATVTEFTCCFIASAMLVNGLKPTRLLVALLAVAVVAFSGWRKHTRREVHRTRHELDEALERAAFNMALVEQVRAQARAVPTVTMCVRLPAIFATPQEDPESWPEVPLLVAGGSPDDPFSRAWLVKVPAGAPWHTPN